MVTVVKLLHPNAINFLVERGLREQDTIMERVDGVEVELSIFGNDLLEMVDRVVTFEDVRVVFLTLLIKGSPIMRWHDDHVRYVADSVVQSPLL